MDYTLWGKTRKNAQGEVVFHPLLHHMLDVAAVMKAALTLEKSLRVRLEQLFATDFADPNGSAARFLYLVAALHDIGKAESQEKEGEE